MKHVVVCEGASDRFKVFCDWRRAYVLDNASEDEVESYFLEIATQRARECVAELIANARAPGAPGVPVTH